MKIRLPPWLTLLILAPAIGELLSGSSPPAEFFQPFSFIIMTALYGCGALICREVKVRWRKGVGSLLLLGCAYAILEEGLMVASFFNPDWIDLGALKGFGRVFDVNWVWVVELIIYHAFFSVTVPVLLVELIYPERKVQPWLSERSLKIAAGALTLDVIGGLFLFGRMLNYYPPLPQYLFFAIVAYLFVRAAMKLSPDWLRVGNKPIRRPIYYSALSFATVLVSGLVIGVLPNASRAFYMPALVILVLVLLVITVLKHLREFNWKEARRSHLLGLVSGALIFFIALTPIQELDPKRVDETAGMMLVGVGFLSLIAYLWLRVGTNDTTLTGNPV